MTVEASYLMPFVLVLSGVLVLVALIMLQRCLDTQNRFVSDFYTKQGFVSSGETSGEVFYGERTGE